MVKPPKDTRRRLVFRKKSENAARAVRQSAGAAAAGSGSGQQQASA
ncbi:MAG: hypothetical protein LBT53_05300 [Puniceicoccales bacterium]|nr:hypothetical protein [Puniceicoccales bacterium]